MADSTRIEEIISQSTLKAFDELKLKVDSNVASLETLIQNAVKLNSTLGSVKSPRDFNSSLKEIEQSEKNITKALQDQAVAQQRLNSTQSLIEQKQALNELAIKNKELAIQAKELAIAKTQQAAADKQAAIQQKIDFQNEKIANEEKIALIKQQQAETAKLTEQQTLLDRAEEARLSNNAVASQPQAGQQPGATVAAPAFIPATELQQSAALIKTYQTGLANARAEQVRLSAALKSGEISQSQYDAQVNKAILLENQYKVALASAQQALTLQTKTNDVAKGSLVQRQLALDRLNKSYALLNATERASAGGQRQLKIIQDLTAQVTTLETSVGKSQRAVGGYGNAITGAFSKAFGVVRQLAYVLPGIGIAGILGALVEPLANLISKLFETNSALKDTQTVLDESKSSYASAAAEVELLKINVGLAKDGFLDKDKVLNQYNTTIGKTTGQVHSLQEAEDALNKNAEAYIKFTFLKAAATVALGKAGEQAVEAELENQKELEKISKINRPGDAAADRAAGADGLSEFLKKGVDNERIATVAANKKRVDQLKKIGADFEKQAAEIAKDFNFNFFGDTKDEGKAEKDNTKLKAITKKFFDDQLKDQAEALKAISKDQDFYLTDRLDKRKAAYAIELDLIKRQTALEIQNEKDKLNAVTSDPKSSNNAKINAQNEYNEKIFEINQKSAYDLEKIETTLGGDLLTIKNTFNLKRRTEDAKDNAEAIATFNKFAEDRKKAELAAINSRAARELSGVSGDEDIQLKNIENQKNALIAASNGSAEAIAKIEKVAQQKVLNVQIEASKLRINIAINTQKALLAVAATDNNQDQVAEAKAKIADLERQLAELNGKQLKLDIDVDTTDLDKFKDALDKVAEVGGKVFDILGGAINASVIAQKNALQDQSDAIEKNTQQEIDAVNATVDTAQNKADKIAVINAKAQAQKDIIAQRQRQLDQRAAEVEKARNIFEIIINTASAIAKSLPNIPLAVLAGALGAAQLAVAIATPVPKFETGTLDAPGGDVIVGEKRKELVVTPDGRLIETPGRPTVMNIPKHSIIFPDSRALMEGGIGKRELSAMKKEDQTALFHYLGSKMDRVGRIIKDKAETHISRRGDGWDIIKKSGGNRTKYIN